MNQYTQSQVSEKYHTLESDVQQDLNHEPQTCKPYLAVEAAACNMKPPSPKRPRRTYDEQELGRLETVFAANSYPDREYRMCLAREMGVSPKNIQIWFQNRRARERTIRRKAEGIVENPINKMRFHLNTWPKSSNTSTDTRRSGLSEIQLQGNENGNVPNVLAVKNSEGCPLFTDLAAGASNKTQCTAKAFTWQGQENNENISHASPPVGYFSAQGPTYHCPSSSVQMEQLAQAAILGRRTSSLNCYRVSVGSNSNLSDISNSSFTELLTAFEGVGNDDYDESLSNDSATLLDELSPLNYDFVFEF